MLSILTDKRLSAISGIFVIILYCVFTLVSWFFYPHPFTPWDNYLSRLGNFDYSPFGATFYNLGCILTGVALFPFFLGLGVWYSGKKQTILLAVGQILGGASGVALILIGVYSENLGEPHMIASSVFFILNFLVLILICIALFFNRAFPKLGVFWGLAIDVLVLILPFFIGTALIEWFTVFSSLAFVGMVSFSGYIRFLQKS
ncbi:MAG: hypothetical protein GF411_06150 [Candidatus Lokiarchaeota archaeon]|nr:hypothetical protein [Candidatus Lokiarchaeota archaeon]